MAEVTHGAVHPGYYLPERALCGEYLSVGTGYVDLTDGPGRAERVTCPHCLATWERIMQVAAPEYAEVK